MEFPIIELLDYDTSVEWLLRHFHPEGLQCPRCEEGVEEARKYRHTQVSQLTVYRCTHCETTFNLYTGTVFQGSQWTPMQAILLLRGIAKGESTNMLAVELALNYKTVLTMRHRIQANAVLEQPNTPLPDSHSETDEMFQNAGEKR